MFQCTEDISKALSYQAIEQVGIDFFSALGHTSLSQQPVCSSLDALNFMYNDMHVNEILTTSDRITLQNIVSVSYLFRKDSVDFLNSSPYYIQYFSVDIDDNCTDRSQTAFSIHQVIAKATEFCSVILFRHQERYLLSFHYRTTESKDSIILSDWFDEYKEEEFFNSISAYNFSERSSIDFFIDFIYAAARYYYVHPVSKEYIRFIILPSVLMKDGEMQHLQKNDLADAIMEIYKEPVFAYSDDFVEDNIINETDSSIEDIADDIDFDLVEYELEHMGAFDEEFSDEEELLLGGQSSVQSSDYDASTIAPDILKDPVKLLEWLNQKEKDSSTEDAIVSESPEDNLLEGIEAEGLDYVDNRSKGGVLWLLGGEELGDFVKSISSSTKVFRFKQGGGRATNGEDGWWLK